jgi:2'-5' RNA ligase
MSAKDNGFTRTGAEGVNQFALVIYFPDPLARFLDELRLELVAGCRPRAHVTVLPPRPLANVESALEQTRVMAPEFPPFEIEAGDIEIFPQTNVIYIELRRGAEAMEAMHAAMNTAELAFKEPHVYHPHITLAQEFPVEDLPRLAKLTRERWQAWRGPRSFLAETIAFVQNTQQKRWLDLATFGLGQAAPVRKRRS